MSSTDGASVDGASPAGPDLDGPVPDGLRAVDVLTVTAVTDVTPSVRRVLLTGHPDAVAAAGPTVNLLVPRVGDVEPRWPRIQRDGRIVWPQGSHGVALRSYTARRQDPAAGELEIDFVLHGDGPAAAWAAAARPGALLAVAGAASLAERPARWLLLAGDETALPAISRLLAAAPPDTAGVALLEVAGPEEEQPDLVLSPGTELRWLHRGDAAPGEVLVAAVRATELPAGRGHLFVHGEAYAVRELRRHLRGLYGLAPEWTSISGYWRRGDTEDGWQSTKQEWNAQIEAEEAPATA